MVGTAAVPAILGDMVFEVTLGVPGVAGVAGAILNER